MCVSDYVCVCVGGVGGGKVGWETGMDQMEKMCINHERSEGITTQR